MSAREPGWSEARPGGRPARAKPVARLIRSLRIAALSLGLFAAALGAYCGAVIYEGNFHAVRDGVLYRSAQLSKGDFASVVRRYGIKSVLNLRGAHAGESWYDDEIAASGELGLAHYDYPLSAKRLVTRQQIAQILDIVRAAPKPLLVHCKSGADRAGLVAALYRFALAGATAEQADRELSLIYGHFPYLTSRSGAMDESFWAFVHGTARPAGR